MEFRFFIAMAHTLSEMMKGDPRGEFAKAVKEYARANHITPAQAAKELLEQRGDARMMAKSGKSKNDTTEFHLNRTLNELSNNIFKVKSERKYKGEIQEFIESLSEDTNRDDGIWYLSKDRKRLFRINTSLEHYEENKNETGYGFEVADWYDFTKFTDEQKTGIENLYKNDETRRDINSLLQGIEFEDGTSNGSDGLLQDGETAVSDAKMDKEPLSGKSIRGRDIEGGRRNNGRSEGLDLSDVQLMEGSDGTVYGWCEIERDADGNVVARHIYLNDEVLNANTMVHELGHLWLNLLSEINPKLYEHGLGLAKKHPLFAELKESDEYGMLSDDEIADEVLARMIGDRFVRKQKNGTPIGVPFSFFLR